MDFSSLLTPLTYSVTGIIATVYMSQLLIDLRRSKWQRTYRNLANESIRKNESRSFTAIIGASDDIQLTLSQIDQLNAEGYKKLQIIITVDSTTEKSVVNALRRYQRTNKQLGLKIVKRSDRIAAATIARRYATGDLLVFLAPGETVSRDFFMQASIRFMDASLDGLSLRQHHVMDSRLISGFAAWATVQQDMLRSITNPTTALVVRKTSFLSDSFSRLAYTSRAAIHTKSANMNMSSTLRPFICIVLMAGIIAGLFMNTSETLFPFIASVLALLLLLIGQLLATPGYSSMDRLNLVLLLPFELMYSFIHTLIILPIHVVRSMVNKLRAITRERTTA